MYFIYVHWVLTFDQWWCQDESAAAERWHGGQQQSDYGVALGRMQKWRSLWCVRQVMAKSAQHLTSSCVGQHTQTLDTLIDATTDWRRANTTCMWVCVCVCIVSVWNPVKCNPLMRAVCGWWWSSESFGFGKGLTWFFGYFSHVTGNYIQIGNLFTK